MVLNFNYPYPNSRYIPYSLIYIMKIFMYIFTDIRSVSARIRLISDLYPYPKIKTDTDMVLPLADPFAPLPGPLSLGCSFGGGNAQRPTNLQHLSQYKHSIHSRLNNNKNEWKENERWWYYEDPWVRPSLDEFGCGSFNRFGNN